MTECPTQASDLLLKMHFTTVDVDKLKAWLEKWPFGTSKDGFGLPKTMLPMHAAVHPPGVKISFKGTPDPWLQLNVEGDVLVVYRYSMMSPDMLRVSALKQREEGKVCAKLKEDLARCKQEGCGATLTNSDKAFSLMGAK